MENKGIYTEQENDTTYDHVIKYTGLFGGVQGITMLMGIVRNKIAAMLLGPSGIALVSIYNKVMSLVNQSTNFGISFSAVRHVAELFDMGDEKTVVDFVNTVRTWSLLTAVLGMLVCCVLSPWISLWTFKNYDYTLTFCLLSPVAATMALTGGEIAILKGMKQLKKVATISVFAAFATLLICSPVYFFLGIRGIVFSLVAGNIAVLCVHLWFSTKVVSWSTSVRSMSNVMKGVPMIKLGVAYIIAGLFGQGADYIINTSIFRIGELADVGLYNTGYIMAVSYASLVFVAIEADYFPRLSAAERDTDRMNHTVNQQMEVCVLLIAPCLIFFVIAMPLIISVLYSADFMAAVPMAVSASFFMFFKALTLPVAYLPLAKGDSKMYMFTELIYDVFIAIVIPVAFRMYGLVGAGWALSLGGFIDFVIIHVFYRLKYKFKFDFSPVRFYVIQFLLFSAAVYAALQLGTVLKWLVGMIMLSASLFFSLRVLRRETTLMKDLKKKLGDRLSFIRKGRRE
ncbi:MAG: oligosaccharide flippase family protein [Bacteroides sp.]|nr:oligosaccharide flippase family protein [Roseburia sp.]MCM1345495.1 oligosaccharide flippase family protein [Bacteroides sp.]MCM1420004.1 oligosaccharide flippase family protein [Bacteroides sp.]